MCNRTKQVQYVVLRVARQHASTDSERHKAEQPATVQESKHVSHVVWIERYLRRLTGSSKSASAIQIRTIVA